MEHSQVDQTYKRNVMNSWPRESSGRMRPVGEGRILRWSYQQDLQMTLWKIEHVTDYKNGLQEMLGCNLQDALIHPYIYTYIHTVWLQNWPLICRYSINVLIDIDWPPIKHVALEHAGTMHIQIRRPFVTSTHLCICRCPKNDGGTLYSISLNYMFVSDLP